MAINSDYDLAYILNQTNYGRRYDIWLWHRLVNRHKQSLGHIDQPGARAEMASIMSNDPDLAEFISKRKSEEFLPAKYFDWIDEGKRQIIWLNSKTKNYIDQQFDLCLSYLPDAALLIARIDVWDVSRLQKEALLHTLKHDWTDHKKGDKQFKWFEDENQKCLLAGKWLNKNIQLETLLSIEMSMYLPIENYEDLLIYFDHSKFNHHQTILYIDKIKKSWSQQKYRQGLTDKGQYNFILSDKAIRRLDKFADDHELSRARILDILLKMETEKNLYIPEMLKRLKDGS
ncbi:hypothetical protein QN399_20075 [Pseudomonas sp. 10C3]|uniref:hypothetical protein n=1 Tax=Pseudomonas sp. 10C3 TaxID=3118753 RepID=UPI002E8193C4|nr:hypothetical protein [Pseudomonas sp. 10C3]MEE3508519.1 hypothetical protein [Pseudomonas sp. 10C3]